MALWACLTSSGMCRATLSLKMSCSWYISLSLVPLTEYFPNPKREMSNNWVSIIWAQVSPQCPSLHSHWAQTTTSPPLCGEATNSASSDHLSTIKRQCWSSQVRQGNSLRRRRMDGSSLPPHTNPALYFATAQWKELPCLSLGQEMEAKPDENLTLIGQSQLLWVPTYCVYFALLLYRCKTY